SRAKPPWDRCARTCPGPTQPIINPRTSPSISCRSSRIRRATRSSGTQKYAAGRWRLWSNTCTRMPDVLGKEIDRYLADLRLQNASPHTLRNYASDLEQFAGYFCPPGQHPPAPAEFTVLQIRE